MIAVAMASVPWTITGESEFGRMCENRIARGRTPTERAASTKSCSRWASTDPRRSRAKIGTLVTPTATMICQRPGPSIATSPIASSRPGIASMMSIRRMITESTQAAEVAGDRAEQQPDREPGATPPRDRSRANSGRRRGCARTRPARAGRGRTSGEPKARGSTRRRRRGCPGRQGCEVRSAGRRSRSA